MGALPQRILLFGVAALMVVAAVAIFFWLGPKILKIAGVPTLPTVPSQLLQSTRRQKLRLHLREFNLADCNETRPAQRPLLPLRPRVRPFWLGQAQGQSWRNADLHRCFSMVSLCRPS